jgi:hypothetical protein
MKTTALVPLPARQDSFRRSRERFIPSASGCYVLSTLDNDVLYVGLAKNLRRRFNQHLDNEQKTNVTPFGAAIFFHWFETDDINKVERTWMNTHIEKEGTLPLLNSAYSPTST